MTILMKTDSSAQRYLRFRYSPANMDSRAAQINVSRSCVHVCRAGYRSQNQPRGFERGMLDNSFVLVHSFSRHCLSIGPIFLDPHLYGGCGQCYCSGRALVGDLPPRTGECFRKMRVEWINSLPVLFLKIPTDCLCEGENPFFCIS
ncbi:uncharacterized protein RBU57_010460 isoform 1-T2 [Macrochelys suwanniensis]